MRYITKNSIAIRVTMTVLLLFAMCGGMIVSAYVEITPEVSYQKDKFHLRLNESKMEMRTLSASSNSLLKILSINGEMPFNISYTSGYINTSDKSPITLSLISSNNEYISIYDKYEERKSNVLIIDYVINTDLSTNKDYTHDLSFEQKDKMQLVRSFDDGFYSYNHFDWNVIKIPISVTYNNLTYYASIYYVTIKYVMPDFIINTWLDGIEDREFKYTKNIPLLSIYDNTGKDYLYFNVRNIYRLTSESNVSTDMYQTNQILDMLSSIKSSLGNSDVITAINNNAQTVAGQVLDSGKKVVTAVDEAADKIIEFDLGEVPDEILEELAAQDEYLNEQEEQFNDNFDKALEEYEQYTIESAKDNAFFTEFISPFYDLVSSMPYVPVLLSLVLVVIVIVFIFRR